MTMSNTHIIKSTASGKQMTLGEIVAWVEECKSRGVDADVIPHLSLTIGGKLKTITITHQAH